jgi:6-pyruvoyltetrahydropterin/6-carboxytetrahydropterin synthase
MNTTAPNSSYQLIVKFRFEAAHRLAKDYSGKCSNIHGHSFNGELAVTGTRLNDMDMAIDYADLKVHTKSITNDLDHKLLLYKNDIELISFCQKSNLSITLFDANPTSEVIAHYIYHRLKSEIKTSHPAIDIDYVTIEETCSSRCKYTSPS